jgi:steroid 5-alpha reductase family enzyme
MACLATVWGVRLTYNFHRRGGYAWPPWTGEEDYRWEQLRLGHYLKILQNPVAWSLFNLTFISFYQNLLLLLIVTPSFVCYTIATDPACVGNAAPLNLIDVLATILFMFFVVVESIADNQQLTFQTEKYRQINAGQELKGEYKDGFCQSGLYSILRKPNYAAEQSIWISFYIFSIAATGGKTLFNWSISGLILLVLLFQGSGMFILLYSCLIIFI